MRRPRGEEVEQIAGWLLLVLGPLLAALVVFLWPFGGCGFSVTLPSRDDLLFYDRTNGDGEFWNTTGSGWVTRIGAPHLDWLTTWALIVPGRFGDLDNKNTDLLFYDRTNGLGDFWATDGQGGISRIAEPDPNWNTTWNLIVPGNFGGDGEHTDLLFYDRANGLGAFFATDGQGGMWGIAEPDPNWNTTWDLIVPGNFGGDGEHTDLLFYDRRNGVGAFFATDGQGGMWGIAEPATDWDRTWNLILPGDFTGGADHTGLLFYDRRNGVGAFWATDGEGGMSRIGEPNTNWRTTWNLIVPGRFSFTGGRAGVRTR